VLDNYVEKKEEEEEFSSILSQEKRRTKLVDIVNLWIIYAFACEPNWYSIFVSI